MMTRRSILAKLAVVLLLLVMLMAKDVRGNEQAVEAVQQQEEEVHGRELQERSPTISPETSVPSDAPSPKPTSTSPSTSPTTSRPSKSPSKSPTTSRPSKSPSKSPTTSRPSKSPSKSPTTSRPSKSPSKSPTTSRPSKSPSKSPTTSKPSKSPSKAPTTSKPSRTPSRAPTTSRPSKSPSAAPTTSRPSKSPSKTPTTSRPTASPTKQPTHTPTESPTIEQRAPNVLLIMVDDLKPTLSAYNSPLMPEDGTPNMDRIVRGGVSFMNAHTQIAICGPSRASYLTSVRPDELRIYSLAVNTLQKRIATSIRAKKEIITLPKLFKLAGYNVYGVGKIFHENEYVLMQRADTWTVPVFSWVPKLKRAPSFTKPYQGGWITSPDVEDDAFADGQAAILTAKLLKDVLVPETTERPFFLAVGLWKPHVPWSAPKKYFDKCPSSSEYHGPYKAGQIKNIAKANLQLAKGGVCGETAAYQHGPKKLAGSGASADALKMANRAYHATTIYADAQIGVILDALEETGARDNTIIVLLGDHGFHLGDHGLYCKKTNYEQATKVPFVINVPRRWGDSFPRNERAYAPVELLDLMPTLYELAGLTIDLTKYRAWMGTSLVPMLRKPDTYVKQAAVSQFQRTKGSKKVWGHSVRTVRYRYTKWTWKTFEELYDYLTDEFETISVHGTKKDLRNRIISNGFYAKNFQKGKNLAPFDYTERTAMANKPPPQFA